MRNENEKRKKKVGKGVDNVITYAVRITPFVINAFLLAGNAKQQQGIEQANNTRYLGVAMKLGQAHDFFIHADLQVQAYASNASVVS